MQASFLVVEDLRLMVDPVLFHPELGLVFAVAIGSGEEARGLRHAVSDGRLVAVYLPDGNKRWVPLRPGSKIREIPVWVKGLPRVLTALYLPAARAVGGPTRWLFPVGPAEDFYTLIEAISPFPIPRPGRRMAAAEAAEALAWMVGRGKPPAPPGAGRLEAALKARTLPSGENARAALPDFVRPLEGPRPEGWTALAIREDFLPTLLEALRE